MKLFIQLFAATVGGNQLNASLCGWTFLIGVRKWLRLATLNRYIYIGGLTARDLCLRLENAYRLPIGQLT